MPRASRRPNKPGRSHANLRTMTFSWTVAAVVVLTSGCRSVVVSATTVAPLPLPDRPVTITSPPPVGPPASSWALALPRDPVADLPTLVDDSDRPGVVALDGDVAIVAGLPADQVLPPGLRRDELGTVHQATRSYGTRIIALPGGGRLRIAPSPNAKAPVNVAGVWQHSACMIYREATGSAPGWALPLYGDWAQVLDAVVLANNTLLVAGMFQYDALLGTHRLTSTYFGGFVMAVDTTTGAVRWVVQPASTQAAIAVAARPGASSAWVALRASGKSPSTRLVRYALDGTADAPVAIAPNRAVLAMQAPLEGGVALVTVANNARDGLRLASLGDDGKLLAEVPFASSQTLPRDESNERMVPAYLARLIAHPDATCPAPAWHDALVAASSTLPPPVCRVAVDGSARAYQLGVEATVWHLGEAMLVLARYPGTDGILYRFADGEPDPTPWPVALDGAGHAVSPPRSTTSHTTDGDDIVTRDVWPDGTLRSETRKAQHSKALQQRVFDRASTLRKTLDITAEGLRHDRTLNATGQLVEEFEDTGTGTHTRGFYPDGSIDHDSTISHDGTATESSLTTYGANRPRVKCTSQAKRMMCVEFNPDGSERGAYAATRGGTWKRSRGAPRLPMDSPFFFAD